MRHRKKTVKLGRSTPQREALLSGLVCDLIRRGRIRTTLGRAKAARPLAERTVTLGKRGTLAARRRAVAKLRSAEAVGRLFSEIAPAMADRPGGYTRILKLGKRAGDAAEVALLEWVTYAAPEAKKSDKKKAAASDGGAKKG